MTRRARWWQLPAVAALGVAGLGAGHVAEYLLLAPHHHARQELLAATGHHYLPVGLQVAMLAGLLAVVGAFVSAVRRAAAGQSRPPAAHRWARLLPVAQAVAFVALEVGERVAAHASLGDLGTVLVVGLPLQLVVGALARLLVTGVERAGELLGSALRGNGPAPARRRVTVRTPSAAAPASLVLSAATPPRGPPPTLVLS